MLQQQRDLFVRKAESTRRQALLIRPLVEDTQFAKPPVHTVGGPAIAVPADEQLVPKPSPGVTGHPAAERFRRLADGAAIVFGRRGIAQRLMVQIAAVADELAEQHDVVVGPCDRRARRRHHAGQRYPIAGLERIRSYPAAAAIESMATGNTDGAPSRERDSHDGTPALEPDAIAFRRDDISLRGHSTKLGRRNQLRHYRKSPTIV